MSAILSCFSSISCAFLCFINHVFSVMYFDQTFPSPSPPVLPLPHLFSLPNPMLLSFSSSLNRFHLVFPCVGLIQSHQLEQGQFFRICISEANWHSMLTASSFLTSDKTSWAAPLSMLESLNLWRSCGCCHSHCEFLCTMVHHV